MERNYLLNGSVTMMIVGTLLFCLNGCAEKKPVKNEVVQVQVQEENDEKEEIVVPEGKIIPYEEVAKNEEYTKRVKDHIAVKIISYLLAYDIKAYPAEDWIASLRPLYQEMASQYKIGEIDYSYEGTRKLRIVMQKVEAKMEDIIDEFASSSSCATYEAARVTQNYFLDIYSIHCLKHQLKSTPENYHALANMDSCFKVLAEAQIDLNAALNPSWLHGSIGLIDAADYTNHVYYLRPMTSFLFALNDSNYKTPNATSLDLETLLLAEYDLIGKEKAYEGEEEHKAKAVKAAKAAFAKYYKASTDFLALQPDEYKDKISRIIDEKNRMLLVDLKTRMQEFSGSEEPAELSYKSSDSAIKAYKYSSEVEN